MSNRERASVWAVISALAFAVVAVLMRHIGREMQTVQATFLHCLFGLLIMSVPMYRQGRTFHTPLTRLYVLRACSEAVVMLSLFIAYAYLPLAEVATLTFTLPLFGILGAWLVLGERVGLIQCYALGLGFLGVLIVLHPGTGEISGAMLLPLLAAFSAACGMLTVKQLAKSEPTDRIIFYMFAWIALIVLVPALYVWTWPRAGLYPWLVCLSLSSLVAHGSLARGLALMDASFLFPFKYLQLLFVVLLGQVVYGELPTIWTVCGAALILSAVFWASRQGQKKEVKR